MQSSSEGVAGKIKEKYTYVTVEQDRLITIYFTAVFFQCGNYPEEPRKACQEEKNKFEQDDLVSDVVDSIEF